MPASVQCKSKSKGKVRPRTGHEGPEGTAAQARLYYFFPLVLDRGGWLRPRPGHFIPGKETRYPLYKRLCRPHGWSGWVQKILPTSGFNLWTVQPIPSCYTDYAIPAHHSAVYGPLNNQHLLMQMYVKNHPRNSFYILKQQGNLLHF
jgi:hypothetical protein